MPGRQPLVMLIDVDNTLLDNDRFLADLGDRLQKSFGHAGHDRYWALYEKTRNELGYADYLGTLQAFRTEWGPDPQLLHMSSFLLEYPFAQRVYPHALDALAHLATLGSPVVLSDGDIVFQPRKIQRSGIWEAVDGRVLIFVHKERELETIEERYPAEHYVMVDDKPGLLAAMKKLLGRRLTTVFVRQGHYALAPTAASVQPAADMTVEQIGELARFDAARLAAAR